MKLVQIPMLIFSICKVLCCCCKNKKSEPPPIPSEDFKKPTAKKWITKDINLDKYRDDIKNGQDKESVLINMKVDGIPTNIIQQYKANDVMPENQSIYMREE